MRILIHGLNFAPELVGVGKFTGDMAEWLAERGHEVRVVTAPPFNPASQVFAGFSAWSYRREDRVYSTPDNSANPDPIRGANVSVCNAKARDDGNPSASTRSGVLVSEVVSREGLTGAGHLSVFRCPLWVPSRPSGMKRVFHLASFAFTSLWNMLRQVPWHPEVVLVIEPTLLCAPTAWLTGWLSGARTWFHVQDFEVDAAFDLGLLTSPRFRRLAAFVEGSCMQGFDRVSTISEKMSLRLIQKGVEASRCLLFPNWVDTSAIFPLVSPSSLRRELGISPKAVVALYSGSMAHKQGVEVLAEVARELRSRDDLHFVFCGEGPVKSILADLTAQIKSVHLLPLQPLERLNDLLNLADIHLLPQRASAADLVMPSKLTGMLASGRPIVASAPTGTQLAAAVDGRGIVVPPEDVSSFVWAIDHLASHAELREKLGQSARACAVATLDKKAVLLRFEQELLRLISGASASRMLN